MTNNHPARLWVAIRAAFEGRERDQPEDSNAIRVPVLAKRFDVHPNSIYLRSKDRQWQRPAWYRLSGPKAGGSKVHGGLDEGLLAVLRQAAMQGRPCPTNQDLAAQLACSPNLLAQGLKRLKKSRAIKVQKKANLRRIAVRGVKRATGWTALRKVAYPDAAPRVAVSVSGPQQRRAQCLALLRAAAETQSPCPTTVQLVESLGLAARASADLILNHLVADEAFKIERRSRMIRRFVFPDGKATGWTAPQAPQPTALPRRSMPMHPSGRSGITLRPACGGTDEVKRAQLKLQRAGIVAFDRWVLSGNRRDMGQSWSVDGKTVDAAGLIAFAAEQAAKSGGATR